MRNRKNIVLMFLIIMLSFAIVSEVSAAPLDDGEPGESGLNVHPESHNSTGPLIPGERFDEVSNGPVDDSTDTPHSNNDQTSFVEVPHGTYENMNFYEQSYDGKMPQAHNTHDMKSQNQTAHIENQAHADEMHGEKMNNTPSFDLKNSNMGFDMSETSGLSDVLSDVTSELIGLDNVSVAFKNSKHDNVSVLHVFNGVLPPQGPDHIELNESFAFDKGDSGQFAMDLKIEDFLLNENISISNSGLPKIDDAISRSSDFLPNSKKHNISQIILSII